MGGTDACRAVQIRSHLTEAELTLLGLSSALDDTDAERVGSWQGFAGAGVLAVVVLLALPLVDAGLGTGFPSLTATLAVLLVGQLSNVRRRASTVLRMTRHERDVRDALLLGKVQRRLQVSAGLRGRPPVRRAWWPTGERVDLSLLTQASTAGR